MSMMEAILAWIGICSMACIMALGVLWIGWKLFGKTASDSIGGSHSLERRLDALELRIKALEMKAKSAN